MSPSTNPGESTKVTRLNRFCLDVQISVLKYSETPAGEFKEFLVKGKSEMQLIKIKLASHLWNLAEAWSEDIDEGWHFPVEQREPDQSEASLHEYSLNAFLSVLLQITQLFDIKLCLFQ